MAAVFSALVPGLFYTFLFLLLPLIFAYLYGVRIGKGGIPFFIISYGLGLILVYVSSSVVNYVLLALEILMVFYAIFKKGRARTRKSRYYQYESKEDGGKNGRDQVGPTPVWTAKGRYMRILNITDRSSLEDVKLAYRELIKQHHPDKFMNAPREEKTFHEKKTREINEAYEYILKLYQ
ncbi:MAG: J domain-containing protein [Fusobacteriaceae bacterium]|jgi:hypothetical protein|nr:J domain-containing protein [Fusobacteriaceae bacterium]